MKKTEVFAQEYLNARFSAGLVDGGRPKKDAIYLQLESSKDPRKNTELHLTPDEALAISFLLTQAVWSWSLSRLGRRKMEQTSLPPAKT